MLQRQIRIKTMDLDTVKEELAVQEQSLKDYIKRKVEFYQKTRNGRAYFEALDKFKEAMAKSE